MLRNIKYLPFILLVFSCSTKKQKENSSYHFSTNQPEYAQNFLFEEKEGNQYLVIRQSLNDSSSQDIQRYELKKPLKRIVCTSTSHLPFLELLEKEDVLIGFPNTQYISSEEFNQRVQDGRVTEVGSDMDLNLEVLLSLKPDAVIAFDGGGEEGILDKVEKLGIPVIYNTDYLETTPLGRAEWIKFFGTILGKQQLADSVFNDIKTNYFAMKEVAEKVPNKPTILSGIVYGDTWFLPGGQNWSSIFFNDAGGNYLWKDDSTSGSLQLSFEAVYEKASQANFWIGTGTFASKEQLASQDGRYASFLPFHTNKIYSFHKKKGPNGGFDYFESGYSRPDLILSDLIKIIHPELFPSHETIYFDQLK